MIIQRGLKLKSSLLHQGQCGNETFLFAYTELGRRNTSAKMDQMKTHCSFDTDLLVS